MWIIHSVPIVHPPLGLTELFAGGVGDAVGVGAGGGAEGAEGGVGVGLGDEAVGVGEGGDGTEGVGVEDAAGAGGAVDEEKAFDGLVDAGAVDPGVGDGVGGVQFQEDVGPVVDEAFGEAVVEDLGEAVALGVEFVGEDASVGVGQGGHASGEVIGERDGCLRENILRNVIDVSNSDLFFLTFFHCLRNDPFAFQFSSVLDGKFPDNKGGEYKRQVQVQQSWQPTY